MNLDEFLKHCDKVVADPYRYHESVFDIPKLLALVRKLREQREWHINTTSDTPDEDRSRDNAALDEIVRGG